MTTAATQKEFDAFEDAILAAYQMNKHSRRRVQIKTDSFGKLQMLEVFIGNVKNQTAKYQFKLFRDGAQVFSYWLGQEERCPLVAKMMHEGYTQTGIAKMLGIHVSTVHKDVRYMRDHTVLLDGYQFRKPADKPVKNSRWNAKAAPHQPAVH
jgi:hypothetical protein